MHIKPQIIDTHTHLYDAVFEKDLDQILIASRERGILAIISVSENRRDAAKNLRLSQKYPDILPAVGLYPGIVDSDEAHKIEACILRNTQRLVAIGEVGLDYWLIKDRTQREHQRFIFEKFIALSLSSELPLNIHSRSAGRHAIELLLQKNAKRVQLHAFDGKASYAEKAVEAGFYFSIPPSVIRSKQKQKLIKRLPLSSLLLETDSPVLGPNPQVRNIPPNVAVAAETIAQIKAVSLEEVYETTLRNTLRLYGHTTPFRAKYTELIECYQ